MQAILLLAHKGIDYIDYFCSQFNNDERFNIFIHIDTNTIISEENLNHIKSKYPIIKSIISKYTGTYFGMDLIDAEIELMKIASKNNYKYYHMMSEQCFITTSLDKFYNYFNKSGKEHIDIQKDKEGWQIINIDKNYRYAGSQWWSLTNKCVSWILNKLNTTNYYNDFKADLEKYNYGRKIHIIAADETFFTTIVMVYKNDFIFDTNKRYYDFTWPLIDWSHPHPLVIEKINKYISEGILNNFIIRKIDYKNKDCINLLNYIKFINTYNFN